MRICIEILWKNYPNNQNILIIYNISILIKLINNRTHIYIFVLFVKINQTNKYIIQILSLLKTEKIFSQINICIV